MARWTLRQPRPPSPPNAPGGVPLPGDPARGLGVREQGKSVECERWSILYKAQLEQGDEYTLLQPVVAIWVRDQNTFRGATGFHHRVPVRDAAGEIELSFHLQVQALDLDRWRRNPEVAAPAGNPPSADEAAVTPAERYAMIESLMLGARALGTAPDTQLDALLDDMDGQWAAMSEAERSVADAHARGAGRIVIRSPAPTGAATCATRTRGRDGAAGR